MFLFFKSNSCIFPTAALALERLGLEIVWSLRRSNQFAIYDQSPSFTAKISPVVLPLKAKAALHYDAESPALEEMVQFLS